MIKGREKEGFTMIELMITVSIIAILSGIAIPIYTSYQARSRTLKARIELSKLFTAQSSFYTSNRSFVTCLNFIGYDPTNNFNQRYYAIGFNSSNRTADNLIINRGILPQACNPAAPVAPVAPAPVAPAAAATPPAPAQSTWHDGTAITGNPPFHGYASALGGGTDLVGIQRTYVNDLGLMPGATAVSANIVSDDGQSFRAVAGGRIQGTDPNDLSIWTIDEQQNLTEVRKGY